ncbi:pilus assembly protein PilP [Nitrosococcus wardiae]|uniref:Pilus assembly protein PilQ n=1 Tax=Nitrosococcus wardiae TaxID=1814290 RepID=A0A4P7BXJ9_9GAMM|nr:pilus assembly protein PilP [Nitrosococcus wardiae]QBQ53874.1 pilus assembly protein PilQ [Nitrosococcus wardiae]
MNNVQHIKKEIKLSSPAGTMGLLGVLLISVSGCSDEQLIDLKQYVEQVKSRPKGTIESLPEIKPHETFTYQAAELRNPFIPTVVELPPGPMAKMSPGSKNTLKPNLNRHREALEEYPLASLKMVGLLEQGEEVWAIVRASDGILYRVKKGNYMGRNYGRITHINEEMIELTEIVSDEQGGWLERQNMLALAE